jgi:sugar phosphate isomerase/epimerase
MDLLAEAGFRELELMITRDRTTHDARVPKALAEERGLRIASVHGPFLVLTRGVWGQEPITKVRRGVEMCEELGADTLVVHPPFLWERTYARWLRTKAPEMAAASGVAIAVETMYPAWVAGRRLRAMRWLDPAELNDHAHTVALDTSHLAVARQDILTAYGLLADKLVHIHLSNNAGDGRDGHLEVEKGILPLDRFVGELRRTRYAGTICLELSVRRYVERDRELVPVLRRNREWVEQRLSGPARIEKGMPR